MKIGMILRLLGAVLQYEGLLMLLPVAVSLIYREDCWWTSLISAAITMGLGMGLRRVRKGEGDALRLRECFVVVVLIWGLSSLVSALPFYLSGEIPGFGDALFEAVSGITATGSTILQDIDGFPRGLHFWRSFTQWMGGMGILMLTVALMPSLGANTVHLMRAELAGSSPGKLVPRFRDSAKTLYFIYGGLSLGLFVILMAEGLSVYEALIHTFSTAGTGGFSSYSGSVDVFANPLVEWTLTAFMILFGMNFAVHYMVVTGDFKKAWRNQELRVYLGIFVFGTALVAWNVRGLYGGWHFGLRDAAFQVSAATTTTLLSTANTLEWPGFSQNLLMLLMFVGGCAGSTAGGIKVLRALLLGKAIQGEVAGIVHPRMVRSPKQDGRPIDSKVLHGTLVYLAAYFAILGLGVLLLSLEGLDFGLTFSAAWANLCNGGAGLGEIGPAGNYAFFSMPSKLVLVGLMLVGRLEIFPILLMFSHTFWRKI